MTNLSHWQEDIDEALGGDFDGSLSGLCIMSLSFDFSRTGNGAHVTGSGVTGQQVGGSTNQANSNQNGKARLAQESFQASNEAHNDNSNNCFKRFKSSASATSDQHQTSSNNSNTNNSSGQDDDESSNQGKLSRQMRHLKNCATQLSASLGNISSSIQTRTSNTLSMATAGQHPTTRDQVTDERLSPQGSRAGSCERAPSTQSTSQESCRSSTIGAISSPSPSQSSSVSTHSRVSSRSQSPSDMSIHSCRQNNNQTPTGHLSLAVTGSQGPESGQRPTKAHQNQSGQAKGSASTTSEPSLGGKTGHCDSQQISLYSMNGGGTLKESSYTTSVITTTAPMHFKSIHHPFSIKQLPLSPFHQFSNSSLNHDFYDRYLSHDSHQPLQTPLIGIERTQDLLSLKLPPHGPDHDMDSQKFPKEWSFGEQSSNKDEQGQSKAAASDDQEQGQSKEPNDQASQATKTANGTSDENDTHESKSQRSSPFADERRQQVAQKGFPFNYEPHHQQHNHHLHHHHKTNNDDGSPSNQREPMDLNVPFDQDEGCCNQNNGNSNNGGREKSSMFLESMKHFNPDREQHDVCYNMAANKSVSPDNDQPSPGNNIIADHAGNNHQLVNQYTGQESVFGIEASKQRFRYVLAAPISVASKLCEDTMTYLNQGQAYEIKLENTTDVAEARKGFMCSIINIGFHERHMQQAENELWQQWSQQHPNEKIFSVDMKLSYNVFGVESDGLNKYEFLWDSSKAAGVFIRINSISTEFTQKKHGGEKGVPFKLSIETFSYNSKTHDSFFISAACCQIKVFKPKGAERKIRSDRDKISKKPLAEQAKYHQSCDHTNFKECSLTSLHPTAGNSLCYYRHSHGHFASKQTGTNSCANTSGVQSQVPHHQVDEDQMNPNAASSISAQQNNISPEAHMPPNQNRNSQVNTDSETDSAHDPRSFSDARHLHLAAKPNNLTVDFTPGNNNSRLLAHHQQYAIRPIDEHQHHSDGQSYLSVAPHVGAASSGQSSLVGQTGSEMFHGQPAGAYNPIYHHGPPTRCVAELPNNQHLNLPYYSHGLPSSVQNSFTSSSSAGYGYGQTTGNTVNTSSHAALGYHAPPTVSQQHYGLAKGALTRQVVAGQEKQAAPFPPVVPTGLSNSVKGSVVANHHHHHHHHPNFPLYHGAGAELATDQVGQTALKESNQMAPYSETHYDNHFAHHPLHHGNTHGQHQASLRHRSASMGVASTQAACTNYAHSAHQIGYLRHGDPCTALGSAPPDPALANPSHWMQTSSNQQLSSPPNSNHGDGEADSGASSVQGENNNNSTVKYGPYLETNKSCPAVGQYDSNQNSPLKNHSTTSNSSSSCDSRFRNNLSSFAPLSSHHSQTSNRCEEEGKLFSRGVVQQISVDSSCAEVVSWFVANRFGLLSKTFSNFSGSDLLRLSRTDMIEICGLSDGIRLYNSLHNQPIKPRRILYAGLYYDDNGSAGRQ